MVTRWGGKQLEPQDAFTSETTWQRRNCFVSISSKFVGWYWSIWCRLFNTCTENALQLCFHFLKAMLEVDVELRCQELDRGTCRRATPNSKLHFWGWAFYIQWSLVAVSPSVLFKSHPPSANYFVRRMNYGAPNEWNRPRLRRPIESFTFGRNTNYWPA